jgi:hypothetical protein
MNGRYRPRVRKKLLNGAFIETCLKKAIAGLAVIKT